MTAVAPLSFRHPPEGGLVSCIVTYRNSGITSATNVSIVDAATTLLDDPAQYERMARRHNPYGDGHASGRIVRIIERFLSEGA